MQIRKNTVVRLQYTLLGDENETLRADETLEYLHGYSHILPALEAALDRVPSGAERTVTLAPEEAYGPHRGNLVFEAPLANLPAESQQAAPGAYMCTTAYEGRQYPLRVVERREDTVVLDGNHPLAGRTLHFRLTVEQVRPATLEEVRARKILRSATEAAAG